MTQAMLAEIRQLRSDLQTTATIIQRVQIVSRTPYNRLDTSFEANHAADRPMPMATITITSRITSQTTLPRCAPRATRIPIRVPCPAWRRTVRRGTNNPVLPPGTLCISGSAARISTMSCNVCQICCRATIRGCRLAMPCDSQSCFQCLQCSSISSRNFGRLFQRVRVRRLIRNVVRSLCRTDHPGKPVEQLVRKRYASINQNSLGAAPPPRHLPDCRK
jgi:hypothetical protein